MDHIKIYLQRLWQLQLGWDEPIPNEHLPPWQAWSKDISKLSSHAVSRQFTKNSSPIINQQLYAFADASTKGYGGVVYLRQQHQDTSVSVALVVSKTRVSPLKQQTIPKLELFAALLTSKLLNAVAKDLAPIYAWTDNSIVLGWLSIHIAHWKVFVSHRVSQIIDVLPPSQRRRVPTRDNPADHASCGLLPLDLVHCSLWWDGPHWLQQPPSSWPSPVTHRPVAELPEARTHVTQANELDSFPTLLWQSFSSHHHLLRVVSWVCRFI